jgi:pimeloyl-ACP methyl ester carboxylesterase
MLAGGAALGAAATWNALLGRATPPLDNPIGGEEGWWTWRGRRIFHTRRGSGPALILVHGIHAAAWSLEWRHTVDALAAGHTVHTLDLLGFGLSERPAIRYGARLYYNLLDDFARQVVREPCVLVASSLSAAYAAILGARDPGRYPALVLVEPAGLSRLHEQADAYGEAARVALDAPVVGSAVFNSLVSRPSLRYWLRRVYADDSRVTDELVDAYHATAHQPGARFAPAAFVAGQLNVNVRSAMRRLGQPVLVVWGEQALEIPVDDAFRLRALKPDVELAIFPAAAGLPHDERPDDFNDAVLRFLAQHHL